MDPIPNLAHQGTPKKKKTPKVPATPEIHWDTPRKTRDASEGTQLLGELEISRMQFREADNTVAQQKAIIAELRKTNKTLTVRQIGRAHV